MFLNNTKLDNNISGLLTSAITSNIYSSSMKRFYTYFKSHHDGLRVALAQAQQLQGLVTKLDALVTFPVVHGPYLGADTGFLASGD